jgi:calcineurin-like phosphoesterase family protein
MRLDINLTQDKEERNVFFTSDFHCYHNNVLKFDNRPFEDIHEMHLALEERWNEVVGPNDIVIYLGDLDFARGDDKPSVEGMMYRLNGTIHFVMGNHDKYADIKKIGKFASVNDYLEVRIKHMFPDPNSGVLKVTETLFCCMHYPIFEWNKKHHGSFHLHGHSHGNIYHGDESDYYEGRRVMDVGCMLHDYRPISYKDVMNTLGVIPIKSLKDRV